MANTPAKTTAKAPQQPAAASPAPARLKRKTDDLRDLEQAGDGDRLKAKATYAYSATDAKGKEPALKASSLKSSGKSGNKVVKGASGQKQRTKSV